MELDGATILLIFEGKPGARLWKDCVVAITEDIDRALDGVRFTEFYDLVAGRSATP